MATTLTAATGVDPRDSPADDLFFEALVRGYVRDNRRFHRRDWLAALVDEKLKENACRFVLLTGEPGAGKSAFMSQLADEHRAWLRYFIRRNQYTLLADVSAKSLLLRIGYQFAVRHPDLFSPEQVRLSVEQRIGEVATRGVVIAAEVKRLIASPFHRKLVEIRQQVHGNAGNVTGLRIGELVIDPRLLATADLLYLALVDPARALARKDSSAQVVVLIDALDEVRYQRTTESIVDWLINCPELPENVRFVLTSRPPDEALTLFRTKQAACVRELAIADNDSHVKNDVKEFVDALVREPGLAKRLADREGGLSAFTATAQEKARGNLGYVDAVARAIDLAIARNDELALQQVLTMQSLPADLEGLYAVFLHQIKNAVAHERVELTDPETGETYDKPVWPAVFDPILGVLAVAMEPLDRETLGRLAGSRAEPVWLANALDRLMQFLDNIGGRYRLYHASVTEFLTNEKTRNNDATADLYQNAEQRHRRIANYYWHAFGEHWERCDDWYALNHLSAHLVACGDGARLRSLICRDWMLAHERPGGILGSLGFLADIDRALAAAQGLTAAAPRVAELFRLHTARLIVGHQTSNHSDIDLETLVWLHRGKEAIALCRLRATPAGRCYGLRAIACSLYAMTQRGTLCEGQTPGDLERLAQELLGEAAANARRIQGDESRVRALSELALTTQQLGDVKLADSLFGQAKKTALDRFWFEDAATPPGGEKFGYWAIQTVANYLSRAGRLSDAQDIAGVIGYQLPARAPEPGPKSVDDVHAAAQVPSDGQEIGRGAGTVSDSTRALAAARQGLEHQAAELLARAIAAERAASEGKGPDLASIIKVLNDAGALDEAAQVACLIEDPVVQAQTLVEIGAAAAQGGNATAPAHLAAALAAVRDIDDVKNRTSALCTIAGSLAAIGHPTAGQVFAESRSAIRQLEDADDRSRGYCGLALVARTLRIAETDRLFEDALISAREIDYAPLRWQRLANIADALGKCRCFARALKTARTIEDERSQSIALTDLAEKVAEANHPARAECIANSGIHSPQRVTALLAVASICASRVDARATALAEEALSAAKEIEDDELRSQAFCEVATCLAAAGDKRIDDLAWKAFHAAESIDDAERRSLQLTKVGCTLQAIGNDRAESAFASARAAADDTEGPDEFIMRDNALAELASTLSRTGRFEEAERTIAAIDGEGFKASSLQHLAECLALAGQGRAVAVFDEAEKQLQGVQQYWAWYSHTCSLAKALARSGYYGRAFDVLAALRADEIINAIIETIGGVPQLDRRSAVDLCKVVCSVAGWTHEGWRRASDALGMKA